MSIFQVEKAQSRGHGACRFLSHSALLTSLHLCPWSSSLSAARVPATNTACFWHLWTSEIPEQTFKGSIKRRRKRRKRQPAPVFLAWKIPQTLEPCGLQSMGSQRVGHNWVNEHRPHKQPWFNFHVALVTMLTNFLSKNQWCYLFQIFIKMNTFSKML